MISPDEWTWLQQHDSTIHIAGGKKVSLDFRRALDGLRIQVSDWALGDAINEAMKLDKEMR